MDVYTKQVQQKQSFFFVWRCASVLLTSLDRVELQNQVSMMTLDYLATNSIAKFLAFSLKLPESFISVYARNKRNLTPIHNGCEDIDTE